MIPRNYHLHIPEVAESSKQSLRHNFNLSPNLRLSLTSCQEDRNIALESYTTPGTGQQNIQNHWVSWQMGHKFDTRPPPKTIVNIAFLQPFISGEHFRLLLASCSIERCHWLEAVPAFWLNYVEFTQRGAY